MTSVDQDNNNGEDVNAKLARMEAILRESERRERMREEREKALEAQLAAQRTREDNEQRRLRFQMLENEDRMRREIDARERQLENERAEKELTMQMLNQKQAELDR